MADPVLGYTLAQQGTNFTNGGASSAPEQKTAKALRYPLRRIDSKSDYFRIGIIKYTAPGFGPDREFTYQETQDDKGNTLETPVSKTIGLATINTGTEQNRNTKPLKYIYLPIPQNLSDISQVTWSDDTLNPLEAFGLKTTTGIAGGVKSAQKTVNDFFGSLGGTNFSNLIKGQKDTISATVGGALYNVVGGNVSLNSIISRATGQVLNPNLELLFQGANLRSFPFVFDFAPRDQREAQEVKQIIKALKYHMTPKNKDIETLGKVFIQSPDIFLISYMSGNKPHPFLNRFKPCVLTDMSISYTGSGTYATYQDGTPVHMQMSLTFKELNPIYASDYEELDSQGDTSVGY